MKKNELTRQGFMDLNLMEANDREGDPSDLWVTLLSLGYNKALEMTEVRQLYSKSNCFTYNLLHVFNCSAVSVCHKLTLVDQCSDPNTADTGFTC